MTSAGRKTDEPGSLEKQVTIVDASICIDRRLWQRSRGHLDQKKSAESKLEATHYSSVIRTLSVIGKENIFEGNFFNAQEKP